MTALWPLIYSNLDEPVPESRWQEHTSPVTWCHTVDEPPMRYSGMEVTAFTELQTEPELSQAFVTVFGILPYVFFCEWG